MRGDQALGSGVSVFGKSQDIKQLKSEDILQLVLQAENKA